MVCGRSLGKVVGSISHRRQVKHLTAQISFPRSVRHVIDASPIYYLNLHTTYYVPKVGSAFKRLGGGYKNTITYLTTPYLPGMMDIDAQSSTVHELQSSYATTLELQRSTVPPSEGYGNFARGYIQIRALS